MRKFIVFVIFIAAVVLLVKNIYKLYGTEGEIVEEKIEVVDTLHLRFKNVPIDGTLKDFVKRMEEAGFKKDDFSYYDDKIVTTATLEGDFAGYKDCVVDVETLMDKDLVSKIIVKFPRRDKWEELEHDYNHFKEMLTTKYGKPSQCKEKMPDTRSFKDTDKIYNVDNVGFIYTTQFMTDKGTITLQIMSEINSGNVAITYQDKINGAEVAKHAYDDL